MTQDRIAGSSWLSGNGGDQVAATGGARSVWHTTEGPSIAAAVSAYRANNSWPHATWDPRTGEVVQHLHVNQSARSVQNLSGGVQTNRYGVVLQVETVAHAAVPFTNGPLAGLDRIMDWMRSNGVPDVWPMGQPLAYGPDERRPGVSPAAYGLNNGDRDPAIWTAKGGHYGHSQVPENDHGDPGRIDITKIIGTDEEEDVPKGVAVKATGTAGPVFVMGVGTKAKVLKNVPEVVGALAYLGQIVDNKVHDVSQSLLDGLTEVGLSTVSGGAVPLKVSLTGTATP